MVILTLIRPYIARVAMMGSSSACASERAGSGHATASRRDAKQLFRIKLEHQLQPDEASIMNKNTLRATSLSALVCLCPVFGHASGVAEYDTTYSGEAASEYIPADQGDQPLPQDQHVSSAPEIDNPPAPEGHIDVIPDDEYDATPPEYSFDHQTGSNAGACDTVLCMGGLVMGKSGGSACSGAIRDFFTIIKFDSDGGFSPSKTAKARGNFLNGCAGAPADVKKKITQEFGRVFSM